MGLHAPSLDPLEQYRSGQYQRTVEIERRIEDGITAEECYDRETDFSLDAVKVILVPGDRVLDLCCGVGAHADRIRAKTGADIDAFDLSDKAISTAASREALVQAEGTVRGKISFALGDMGNILEKIPPAHQYKLITVLGYSFIYLETKEKYKKALTDYFSLLEDGGKLVLQFRTGSPLRRRPKDPVRARDGVVLLSRLAKPSKGRGIALKDGEEYELMQDMAQGDGCYYYAPDGSRMSTDADGVRHWSFGRVYVEPSGTEHDMGVGHCSDFWDEATQSYKGLIDLLGEVGFKNVRVERKPLSEEGNHDMMVLVAGK